jgi:DNA-binding MurR/RpiR family transcriptional regulator
MPTEEAVSEKITARFPSLSRKQKSIARFVMDNEYFVAFASAAEVGSKVNASAATVVRFCQSVGFNGYSHLQAAIRQKFPRFTTTIQRLEERLVSPIAEDDLLARVFATDIDNIKHTMELIDLDVFDAAVTKICNATSILVVGSGVSAPLALFFTHALKVMGIPANVVTNSGVTLSLELSSLKQGDLLVGISFRRYLREAVDAMRWARNVGANRMAITDSELSPLVRWADYAFVTTTDGVAYSMSSVASFSLINAFVASLSFRRPRQTLAALRSIDSVYRESNLLPEV